LNVVHVDHDAAAIADAVRDQVRHGRYERDDLFGDGTAGARIAEVLSRERPRVQKRLHHAYPDPREFDAFRVREEPEPVPRMADGNGAGAEPLSSRDSPR
jgi:hypothetical protein